MAGTTILFGAALVLLGLCGYFLTGGVSVTALIPAAFGAVLATLGVVARNEQNRKHAMHVAVALALLGFLGSVRGLIALPGLLSGAEVERPAAVWAQAIMAILTGVYVALGVRSFIAARRTRAGRT